jgi:CxxC motif-containing protein (DUF1111 family)
VADGLGPVFNEASCVACPADRPERWAGATPEEAILAHDGQGARSRDRFASLDRSARAALLAFLDSL